jgi:hypothetical protein
VSGDPASSLPDPAGVRVVRVPRSRTLRDRYRAWRLGNPNVRAEESPVPTGSPRGPAGRSRLRVELAAALAFPDDARGWLSRAVLRGSALVREAPPDVIVSTGPPHSAHLVALALGAGTRVPRLIDYRDPWVGQPASPTGARLLQTLERIVARDAAGLIATTPELAASLRGQLPETPVYVLYNGTDTDGLPTWEPPAGSGLTVVHVGTLYKGRDPSPIAAAFRRFLAGAPHAQPGSALWFVGHSEAPHRATLDHLAHDPALGGTIRTSAAVARAEALQLLATANLAVVLAQDQAELVPAKLYEAVGIGVPTLVITEATSASAAAAQRVGALHREPHDVAGIASVLAEAWANAPSVRPRPSGPFTHMGLAEAASRILEEVTAGGAR